MITVIDYGAGNLASMESALERLGFAYQRAADPDQASPEGLWLLPGDGHFGTAQHELAKSGWWSAIPAWVASGKPLLGVCVGLQLLAEGSEEAPNAPGLALLPGRVRKLGPGVKVPHMGWSRTHKVRDHESLSKEGWLYFVHSYALDLNETTLLAAEHGRPFTAVAAKDRIIGFQPHPEKSSIYGRNLLRLALVELGETSTIPESKGS
jgi:imidazole glycerol-phosphate synthase subunit HisH